MQYMIAVWDSPFLLVIVLQAQKKLDRFLSFDFSKCLETVLIVFLEALCTTVLIAGYESTSL